MTTASADVEVLIAVLQAAEAQLRWLVAEALPPAAAYRVEAHSTRKAHDALAAVRVERTLSLPPGWAEHVEVDEEIDALLARLVPAEPSLDTTLAQRPLPPPVPPLPVELAAAGPVADLPALPPPPAPAPATVLPPQAVAAPPPAAVEAPWSGQEEVHHDPYAAHEGYAYDGYDHGDAYAAHDGYAEHGAYAAHDGYAEPDAYAPYDDHAPHEDHAAPAPVAPPSAPAGSEADLGFSQLEWAPREGDHDERVGRFDPYANPRQDTALSFVDAGLEEPAPPVADDDELLNDAVERTRAELTVDLSHLHDEDDEGATQVLERNRPSAAAVQLHADGSSSVLGDAMDAHEDTGRYSIALGEADLEPIEDDDLTGILGIARLVEAGDDDDDLPDIEPSMVEIGVDALVAIPPGAPTLTADEIEALFREAHDVARRNPVEGALLYGDVLDADPGHVPALIARARIHLDRSDYSRAISDLLKAEARRPRDAEVQVTLGDLYYARKDYRAAISCFDNALDVDPVHAVALYRRGMSHYYRKAFQNAVDDLEKARRLDPKLPAIDTYLDRARRKQ